MQNAALILEGCSDSCASQYGVNGYQLGHLQITTWLTVCRQLQSSGLTPGPVTDSICWVRISSHLELPPPPTRSFTSSQLFPMTQAHDRTYDLVPGRIRFALDGMRGSWPAPQQAARAIDHGPWPILTAMIEGNPYGQKREYSGQCGYQLSPPGTASISAQFSEDMKIDSYATLSIHVLVYNAIEL